MPLIHNPNKDGSCMTWKLSQDVTIFPILVARNGKKFEWKYKIIYRHFIVQQMEYFFIQMVEESSRSGNTFLEGRYLFFRKWDA